MNVVVVERPEYLQKVKTRLDLKAQRFLSAMREEHRNSDDSYGSNDTVAPTRQDQINSTAHVINCSNAGNDLNRSSTEVMRSMATSYLNQKLSFPFADLLEQEQRAGRTCSGSIVRPQRKSSVTFGTVKIQRYETSEETSTILTGRTNVQESLLTIDEFESCRTSSQTGKYKKRRRGPQVKADIAETRKRARPFKKTTFRNRRKQQIPVDHILNKVQLFLAEGNGKNDMQINTNLFK